MFDMVSRWGRISRLVMLLEIKWPIIHIVLSQRFGFIV